MTESCRHRELTAKERLVPSCIADIRAPLPSCSLHSHRLVACIRLMPDKDVPLTAVVGAAAAASAVIGAATGVAAWFPLISCVSGLSPSSRASTSDRCKVQAVLLSCRRLASDGI